MTQKYFRIQILTLFFTLFGVVEGSFATSSENFCVNSVGALTDLRPIIQEMASLIKTHREADRSSAHSVLIQKLLGKKTLELETFFRTHHFSPDHMAHVQKEIERIADENNLETQVAEVAESHAREEEGSLFTKYDLIKNDHDFGFEEPIYKDVTADWSPDGRYYIIDVAGQIYIYDIRTWTRVGFIDVHSPYPRIKTKLIKFNATGKQIYVVNSASVFRYDLEDALNSYPESPHQEDHVLYKSPSIDEEFGPVALDFSKSRVIGRNTKGLFTVELRGESLKPRYLGQNASAFDLVLSPDGHYLAMLGGQKGEMQIYDTQNFSEALAFPPLLGPKHLGTSALAFSKDGDFFAVGDTEGGIYIFNVRSGEEIHSLSAPKKGMSTSLSFSSDGHSVAAGYQMRRDEVTDKNRFSRVFVWDLASGALTQSLKFGSHDYEVGTSVSVGFSPGDEYIFATGYSLRTHIWQKAKLTQSK